MEEVIGMVILVAGGGGAFRGGGDDSWRRGVKDHELVILSQVNSQNLSY